MAAEVVELHRPAGDAAGIGWPGSESWRMISQGAEARVFECTLFGKPCIAKQRVSKAYRHPMLDRRLRKERLAQEVRTVQRCRKVGIRVPALRFVDTENHIIFMEQVPGRTLKRVIEEVEDRETRVGQQLAQMHDAHQIHGDLTTSNILIRDDSHEPVLIDFGLGGHNTSAEAKAVDLYVLERAFLSTHPGATHLYDEIHRTYSTESKRYTGVGQKLAQVRARGRKREMIG